MPPRRRRHLILDGRPSIAGLIEGYTASCHYGRSRRFLQQLLYPSRQLTVCPPRVAAVLAFGIYQGRLALSTNLPPPGRASPIGTATSAEQTSGIRVHVDVYVDNFHKGNGDAVTGPQARGPEATHGATCECCQSCRRYRANKAHLSRSFVNILKEAGIEWPTIPRYSCREEEKPLKPGELGQHQRLPPLGVWCVSLV